MDFEREKKINQWLKLASELEGDALESFLAQVRNEDAQAAEIIGHSLRKTLTPQGQKGDFLERILRKGASELLVPEAPPVQDPLEGLEQLGHFILERRLGMGGMGVVYRALDNRLKRKVALKAINPSLAADPVYLERFQVEAKSVAALCHPNIVTLYDIYQSEGIHYLTMELIEGVTLKRRIADEPFSLDAFFQVAMPLTSALAAAHEKGIIHRDLKPSNIMIGAEGRPKILDFGLAKRCGGKSPKPHSTATLTAAGMVIGTLAYASPEQLRGKSVEARTDVFSLGIVFFEMLSGQYPFEEVSDVDRITSVIRDSPKPLLAQRSLPQPLVALVEACLMKSVEARKTSKQVLDDLMVLAGGGNPLPKTPFGRRRFLLAAAVLPPLGVLGWNLIGRYRNRLPSYSIPNQERWLLLANFENQTGESLYDELIHTLVARSLEFSRYIKVIRTGELKDALARMRENPNTEPDLKTLREVCFREGIEFLITGTIVREREKNQVNITVHGLPRSSVWKESGSFTGLENVREIIDELVTQMREHLATRQPQQRNLSLPSVTTSNIRALNYYAEGLENHAANRTELAQAAFKAAVDADPEFAGAWERLAVCYSTNGKRAAAFEASTRAMALQNRVSERERNLIAGNFAMLTRNYHEAKNKFLAYDLYYPKNGYVLRQIAHCHTAMGGFSEAVDTMDRARRVPPQNVLNHGMWLVVLTEANRVSKALREARAVRGNFPHAVYPHWGLGLALMASNRLPEARASFEVLAKDSVFKHWGELYLAKLLVLQGKLGAAERMLAGAHGASEGYTETNFYRHIWLGMVHGYQGRKEEAIEKLELTCDLEAIPPNANYLRLTALGLLELGAAERARRPLARLQRMDHPGASAWLKGTVMLVRGALNLVEKRFEQAGKDLMTADVMRCDAFSLWWLARFHRSRGQLSAAIISYERLRERKGQTFRHLLPDLWVRAAKELAQCHLEQGNQNQAERWRQQVVPKWSRFI